MRWILLATLLGLTGCGFLGWATTDPDKEGPRQAPLTEAAVETAKGGLSGFEEGGIYAGVIALVLTAGKSAMRLYSDYQASKKKVAIP